MSNLDRLKASISVYMEHFTAYDYIAYAWLALLFFAMILLSILVARRGPVFSIFILMLSLVLLFAGPFILKHYLDRYLRPSLSTLIEVKKLNFSDALMVTGSIKNISKKSFSICRVDISVIENSDNSVKVFLNQLKPLRKKTIVVDETIELNMTKDFRAVFDGYRYLKNINVSINSECY